MNKHYCSVFCSLMKTNHNAKVSLYWNLKWEYTTLWKRSLSWNLLQNSIFVWTPHTILYTIVFVHYQNNCRQRFILQSRNTTNLVSVTDLFELTTFYQMMLNNRTITYITSVFIVTRMLFNVNYQISITEICLWDKSTYLKGCANHMKDWQQESVYCISSFVSSDHCDYNFKSYAFSSMTKDKDINKVRSHAAAELMLKIIKKTILFLK